MLQARSQSPIIHATKNKLHYVGSTLLEASDRPPGSAARTAAFSSSPTSGSLNPCASGVQ